MDKVQNTKNLIDDSNSKEFSASDIGQILKSFTPKHPALNRVHAKLKTSSSVNVITSYDRMHHRHNRS